MHQFTVSTAAAIVLAAMLSAAPAKAEYNYGPVQTAGQCWNVSASAKILAFGAHAHSPQAPRSRAPCAITVTIDVSRGIVRSN
jgi:hypothetical protein